MTSKTIKSASKITPTPKTEIIKNTLATITDLQQLPVSKLPREGKIMSSKVMEELHFSVAEIAKILGLGERSVWRYIKEEELPKAKYWQDFGEAIKRLIQSKEDIMRARSLSFIDKQMEHASFRDLVGFYKVSTDARREDNRAKISIDNSSLTFEVKRDT